MLHFLYVQYQKYNTLKRCWPWFVFVHSGFVNQKRCQGPLIFAYCQEKPCCNLELDTQTPHSKYILTKKIPELIVDETVIKVGSEYTWLWVAVESKNSEILALSISKERNMFVAERFLSRVVKEFGKHPVPQMEEHGTLKLAVS
ncbi:MAG: DDE-type integrase/transposase/recombinase [Candidatus Nitrosocosmicus sp.]